MCAHPIGVALNDPVDEMTLIVIPVILGLHPQYAMAGSP
jgi:hypothetical protein